jgi:hypothetical protein
MKTKRALLSIIAGIVALTLNVSADHHDEKKGKKKSAVEKASGKRKLPPYMAKFDKNKDGKLCDAEKATAKAAWVKRFDKDGNGKVEGKEMAAAKAAMEERRKARKPKGKDKPKGKGKGTKKGGKKPAPKKG